MVKCANCEGSHTANSLGWPDTKQILRLEKKKPKKRSEKGKEKADSETEKEEKERKKSLEPDEVVGLRTEQ